MIFDWKEVVNKLPTGYSKLFYESFDGTYKECTKCKHTYPKHQLFFVPHGATKDGTLVAKNVRVSSLAE